MKREVFYVGFYTGCGVRADGYGREHPAEYRGDSRNGAEGGREQWSHRLLQNRQKK